jgi:predicted patatin/cPLA2 family phospholipase
VRKDYKKALSILILYLKTVRALVISGGGARAFAGGVAQYLWKKKNEIWYFIGTSTGSLLIPHLLNKTEKIKEIFTSVNQRSVLIGFLFL